MRRLRRRTEDANARQQSDREHRGARPAIAKHEHCASDEHADRDQNPDQWISSRRGKLTHGANTNVSHNGRMSSHIIVLPGGGYIRHAPHEAEPVVDWLGSLGHAASVFRYPVGVRHPQTLDAVTAEIRRVRATGVERVGLLGFSAGGHAAGLAALTSSERVDAAILCYPVVSMLLETHVGSREQLVGLDAAPALRESTSLEKLVTPSSPPFFVWHTAVDASVPVEHSYLLGQALAANGVPHSLHVFPKGRHGIGLARDEGTAEAWTALAGMWLNELDW